jgi:nuclear pore complex protein Nup107
MQEADQREHIALYASALGENAVDRYAVFLANLDVSTSVEDRRIALHRAEDHGLDVIRVAQVTAEKTVYACFTRLPAQRLTLPSIVTRESKLSNDEQMLIRSIEWTTFLEETYINALEQSNVIFRYFLGELLCALHSR